MRFVLSALAIPGLVLALAGCGESQEAGNAPAKAPTYEPTVELSAIQKGSFERLNREEVQTDYARLWQDLERTNDGALPARGDMDFAWLDRDGDGKLSVAEFALWELPTAQAASGAPSLSEDQITKTASVFFHNDVDGDTLMSETEFAAASGKPAPAETPKPAEG